MESCQVCYLKKRHEIKSILMREEETREEEETEHMEQDIEEHGLISEKYFISQLHPRNFIKSSAIIL